MSEWITDRLPTAEDALRDGSVWALLPMAFYRNKVMMWSYDGILIGTPWQPINVPAPYVKPKRWTVEWYEPNNCWHVIDTTIDGVMGYLHLELTHADAAQRICDIYNEVMP